MTDSMKRNTACKNKRLFLEKTLIICVILVQDRLKAY